MKSFLDHVLEAFEKLGNKDSFFYNSEEIPDAFREFSETLQVVIEKNVKAIRLCIYAD